MDSLILKNDSHFKRYIKDKVIRIRDKLDNFKVKVVLLDKDKRYILINEKNQTCKLHLKELNDIEIKDENLKLEVHYLLE